MTAVAATLRAVQRLASGGASGAVAEDREAAAAAFRNGAARMPKASTPTRLAASARPWLKLAGLDRLPRLGRSRIHIAWITRP